MPKLNFTYENNQSEYVLVFLHGWGLDSNSWDIITDKLNKSISILKVDLYGFGKSEKPQNYFDAYEYAYRVYMLLQSLGIRKVILFGHSFGGRLGIILTSVFDVGVGGLYLIGSAGLKRFNLVTWLKIKEFKVLKFLANKKIIKKSKLRKYGSFDYKMADDVLKCVCVKVINQSLDFLLKYIECETHLVWDKKDKETPYWMCKKFNKKIKSSCVVLLKSGGHFAVFRNSYKFSKYVNNQIKPM